MDKNLHKIGIVIPCYNEANRFVNYFAIDNDYSCLRNEYISRYYGIKSIKSINE